MNDGSKAQSVGQSAKSPFPHSDEKRSPFPRPSLPQAGESLRERAMDVLDSFFIIAAFAGAFVAVALTEWVMHWMNHPPGPWFWTVAAAFLVALSIWRYFRTWPQVKTLGLGARGERQVGRMLEELRALGYEVFHDIPGDGFNVDHALIGPGGVYAIETKTISLPARKHAEVHYDGKRVLVDEHTPDRDPVAQAQAVADHIRDILRDMTGRTVPVRAVVLYPGWWVSTQPRGARVWVLNPKALQSFLKNEPETLTPEDRALFANRLKLHLSAE